MCQSAVVDESANGHWAICVWWTLTWENGVRLNKQLQSPTIWNPSSTVSIENRQKDKPPVPKISRVGPAAAQPPWYRLPFVVRVSFINCVNRLQSFNLLPLSISHLDLDLRQKPCLLFSCAHCNKAAEVEQRKRPEEEEKEDWIRGARLCWGAGLLYCKRRWSDSGRLCQCRYRQTNLLWSRTRLGVHLAANAACSCWTVFCVLFFSCMWILCVGVSIYMHEFYSRFISMVRCIGLHPHVGSVYLYKRPPTLCVCVCVFVQLQLCCSSKRWTYGFFHWSRSDSDATQRRSISHWFNLPAWLLWNGPTDNNT